MHNAVSKQTAALITGGDVAVLRQIFLGFLLAAVLQGHVG